jgi:hypothetical protein
MSVYPSQLKTFVTHKNLIDDVDANDINAIQDELEAVQFTLGRSPTRFTDAQANVTDYYAQIPTSAGDAGGLEADVVGSISNYGQTDRGVRSDTVDYSSVGARLDAIQRGKANHCFKLSATALDIPTSGVAIDDRPRGIRFPRPSVANDPFSLHNGIGVTIKRSAFWTFHGRTVYNLQGSTFAANQGQFNLTVDVDGEWLNGMARVEHDMANNLLIINTFREGFVDRGSRVTLRTSHNSTPTQKVRLATLSGSMIRESD